jgi:hypothetical protein
MSLLGKKDVGKANKQKQKSERASAMRHMLAARSKRLKDLVSFLLVRMARFITFPTIPNIQTTGKTYPYIILLVSASNCWFPVITVVLSVTKHSMMAPEIIQILNII